MSKENKLPQILEINKDILSRLGPINDVRIEQYFKDNNILGGYTKVFESDWISTTSENVTNSNTGVIIKETIVPQALNIEYEKELDIPDYLLPFVKTTIVAKPSVNSTVTGVYFDTVYGLTREWVRIKGDGQVIYDGPKVLLNTIQVFPLFPPSYITPESTVHDTGVQGSKFDLIVNYDFLITDDYPIIAPYTCDVYNITYLDNNDNQFYGGILHRLSNEDTHTQTVGQMFQFQGNPNFYGSGPMTLDISNASINSITGKGVRVDLDNSIYTPGTYIWNLLDINTSITFLGTARLGGYDQHTVSVIGSNITITKIEKIGKYVYFDPEKVWILNLAGGGHSSKHGAVINDVEQMTYPNTYEYTPLLLSIGGDNNTLPYSSITIEQNYDPWPKIFKIRDEDSITLKIIAWGNTHKNFAIKDFLTKDNHPTKFILRTEARILLNTPATESKEICIPNNYRVVKSYGQLEISQSFHNSFSVLEGGTNYIEESASVEPLSKILYQGKEEDVQYKIKVELLNPFFFKENRTYKNE